MVGFCLIYKTYLFRQAVEGQRTYLVYESQLLTLFTRCPQCYKNAIGEVSHVSGSLVKISQHCLACDNTRVWYSQPFVGGIPAGNLLISTAILFSGAIPGKTLRIFSFMNMACISMSSFMNYQRSYLHPAIQHVWKRYQDYHIQDIVASEDQIVIGGDGRADTPGHSAKYGSYSIMDLEESIVLDVQLVQVCTVDYINASDNNNW